MAVSAERNRERDDVAERKGRNRALQHEDDEGARGSAGARVGSSLGRGEFAVGFPSDETAWWLDREDNDRR